MNSRSSWGRVSHSYSAPWGLDGSLKTTKIGFVWPWSRHVWGRKIAVWKRKFLHIMHLFTVNKYLTIKASFTLILALQNSKQPQHLTFPLSADFQPVHQTGLREEAVEENVGYGLCTTEPWLCTVHQYLWCLISVCTELWRRKAGTGECDTKEVRRLASPPLCVSNLL